MLNTAHSISSSCTGVYTIECAAAVLEKTINESKLVSDVDVYFQSDRCFVTWMSFN